MVDDSRQVRTARQFKGSPTFNSMGSYNVRKFKVYIDVMTGSRLKTKDVVKQAEERLHTAYW